MSYKRIAQLRTSEQFAEYIHTLGIQLHFDPELLPAPVSPLFQPYDLPPFKLSNRFCALPMEG